jgi:hypothetical protein
MLRVITAISPLYRYSFVCFRRKTAEGYMGPPLPHLRHFICNCNAVTQSVTVKMAGDGVALMKTTSLKMLGL